MARRFDKTLVDYLVIAISPALIMTLIASLVFFLIEVFYRGQFEGRLQYIFALLVFAAVLVARIAIEEGRGHARLFAGPLAVAAFLALARFVEYQGATLSSFSWLLNAALIALVLWCADKLTWDCTLIDETQRDSGKGLLQLIGWDRPPARTPQSVEQQPDETPEGTSSRDRASANWWQRLRQRRRRPHAPGVWIVYFSLAALPLFGLGQLRIPPADLAARRYAFCLLLIYVTSGLGLLLATSFLALRRYLRQRRVQMPAAMASMWLVIGSMLTVAVLSLAALLPRPNAEYAISRLPVSVGSPRQVPSRPGAGRDAVPPIGGTSQSPAEWADRGQPHPVEGRQEAESSGGHTDVPPNGRTSPEHRGSSGADSQEQSDDGPAGARQPDGERQPQPEQDTPPEQPGPDRSADSPERAEDMSHSRQSRSGRDAGDETSQPKPEADESADGRAANLDRSAISRPTAPMRDIGQKLAELAKWVFYVAVALIGVYWLWRSRAELSSALRGLLHGWGKLWHNLFAARRRRTGDVAAADDALVRPAPRPLAEFVNPFAAGTAGQKPAGELVRYTFEALEAWAREHGCPRLPEQTPHEFARQVGACVASLSRDARILADLYCEVAYAPAPWLGDPAGPADGTLPVASIVPLRQLWQQLRPGVTAVGGVSER